MESASAITVTVREKSIFLSLGFFLYKTSVFVSISQMIEVYKEE